MSLVEIKLKYLNPNMSLRLACNSYLKLFKIFFLEIMQEQPNHVGSAKNPWLVYFQQMSIEFSKMSFKINIYYVKIFSFILIDKISQTEVRPHSSDRN